MTESKASKLKATFITQGIREIILPRGRVLSITRHAYMVG